MNCLGVRTEIKAYIDGELRPWTRWFIARHIASCQDCRREMQEMAELTNEVKTTTNVSAPQGLKDKVLGSLTFQPASGGPRQWSLARGLAGGAAGLVGFVVLAAIIMPIFSRAKESSRHADYLAAQKSKAELVRNIGVIKDFDTTITGRFRSKNVAQRQTLAKSLAHDDYSGAFPARR